MTTITLSSHAIRSTRERFAHFLEQNKETTLSLTSFGLTLVFLSYFILPHSGFLRAIYRHNFLYLLIIPAIALTITLISLRRAHVRHAKSGVLNYVTLGVVFLYGIAMLAIPVVLIAMYMIYRFVM